MEKKRNMMKFMLYKDKSIDMVEDASQSKKKESIVYTHSSAQHGLSFCVILCPKKMPSLTICTWGDTLHFLKTPYKCQLLWHYAKSLLPQSRTDIFSHYFPRTQTTFHYDVDISVRHIMTCNVLQKLHKKKSIVRINKLFRLQ